MNDNTNIDTLCALIDTLVVGLGEATGVYTMKTPEVQAWTVEAQNCLRAVQETVTAVTDRNLEPTFRHDCPRPQRSLGLRVSRLINTASQHVQRVLDSKPSLVEDPEALAQLEAYRRFWGM